MRGTSGGWRPQLAIASLAASAGFLTQQAFTQQAGPAPNRYVDPALCAQCHAALAANYRKTGMGRSFYHLPAELAAGELTTAKPFYHAASENYFAMLARGGKYYQRRWQIGPDGQETNVDEKQVDFVMGSGNHSRTYLHLTGRNTLQQLPFGWYAEKGGYWGMNPGYDKPDFPGPTRLVGYQCMFCHNAYPRIPAAHSEENAEAQYVLPLPEGIDCQRCHGPGQRHIAAVNRPGAKPEEIRAAIVNPKRLTPQRELEVCLQCHLETSSQPLPHSIQRQNRGPFSYLPGQPLGDFRLSFDRAAKPRDPGEDRLEVAHAGYRLMESQCFLKSEGKLRCTTCHDPHDVRHGETAAAAYNGVCLSCHQTAIQREVAAGSHTPDAACVSCHMPKRRTDEAVHVVMTDHFIRRQQRPAAALVAEKGVSSETPAAPYRGEVASFYPAQLAATAENALDAATAQLRDRSNLKDGLPRLAGLIEKYHPPQPGYYADLAEGYLAAGDSARMVRNFEEAMRRAPASTAVLLRFANALVESRQWPRAETVLRSITAKTADDPVAWGLLGQALWQQGKIADAKPALEHAVRLNGDLPEVHNYLGAALVGGGDLAAGEKEFRAALRIEPGIAEWQTNLANLLAMQGQAAEAQYRFESSIRLKPAYAGARLGYARLLANSNRIEDAEQQAKAAVEADPGAAPAHELWGDLLDAKGDADGAVRELQAAVRLQPDLWRAQYELGAALARKGDVNGAAEHLRVAARGADPEAKAAALQLLQRLGR